MQGMGSIVFKSVVLRDPSYRDSLGLRELVMTRFDPIDVAGTGFTVLDRIYEGTSKTLEELGGSCANVLWSLAMLRRRVVPILSLGADEVGRELVDAFRTAGADVSHIAMHQGRGSPILAQHLDRHQAIHTFSFRCPETNDEYPRYQSIGAEEAAAARPVVERCAVFYCDRLSIPIVEAMEATARAHGIVFFEPSEIGDVSLFARAVRASGIVKYSADRLGRGMDDMLSNSDVFQIVTCGASGLEVRRRGAVDVLPAYPADRVEDTSGSGDMVSVGLIDRLVAIGARASTITLEDVVSGVRAGQKLATANCAHVGARGIFRDSHARNVRAMLED
jgi:fructokinase